MPRPAEAAIDFVEAAYNLDLPPREWLGHVIESGSGLINGIDRAAAAIWSGFSERLEPMVSEMYVSPKYPDLWMRYARVAAGLRPEEIPATLAYLGRAGALSENPGVPQMYKAFTESLECKDQLALFAADPNGRGVNMAIPSAEIIKLTPPERQRWDRLVVHLTAAHRLRSDLRAPDESPRESVPISELVPFAEAIFDPSKCKIEEAAAAAQTKTASEAIRTAAVRIDRARGKLRKTDPDEALSLWWGLVRGRWSLVDWFDTDGRRFVIAKQNSPDCGDPRGLSETELQVATYLGRGESQKLVAYRLGLSRSRVSQLLRQAKKKLKIRTQAELMDRFYPGRLLTQGNEVDES